MATPFSVGVDFDNTIVGYDEIFHRVALEQGLIPPTVPAGKSAVRDYLREADREDDWTELQGYVYGRRMSDAEPFPGVIEFFARCRSQAIDVYIVSHKTRSPYRGPAYDLHAAARAWLAEKGFHDAGRGGLPKDRVYLEPSKEAKRERIAQSGVSLFLDDLPEFLCDPAFPEHVQPVLFDPAGACQETGRLRRVSSWRSFGELVERENATYG